jgi:hypothetical protein
LVRESPVARRHPSDASFAVLFSIKEDITDLLMQLEEREGRVLEEIEDIEASEIDPNLPKSP